MTKPRVDLTEIDGLFVVDLDVRDDPDRAGASFREAFQAEKMRAAGLPDFHPIQYNVAESTLGTLRGIHAEPWEKFIHVVHGEAFAAIADVRPESPTAGKVWQGRLDRTKAILVSRGLGNSYQALTDLVVYTYLVNEHWREGVSYPAVAWDDPDLAIAWPISDERLQLSAKDRSNPSLQAVLGRPGLPPSG